MSVEAITLALGAKVERSSTKFVLVAMANCANNDMTCWPSILYLCEATSQDRKTVLENIKRLREAGFIRDTGERKGGTSSIPVYELTIPKAVPKTERHSQPKNGTASADETVPFFPISSPEIPEKQSRFSVEAVPKTGHGTVKEPSRNRQQNQKRDSAPRFDASLIELPDSVPRDAWNRWIAYRRDRKLATTEQTALMQAKRLGEWAEAGHEPASIIDNTIANGWQGLFEPKANALSRSATRKAPALENFDSRDYGTGGRL